MISLKTFANHCEFELKDGKCFIVADGQIIKEVELKDYGNIQLLSDEFQIYLKKKWPTFWQNPLKYFGLIR